MGVLLTLLLVSQTALGFIGYLKQEDSSQKDSDILDLDFSERMYKIDESEEQEDFHDFDFNELSERNERSLPSDWKTVFEDEHDAEDLDENPFVIDHDYPELILPLTDESDFDTSNPTHIGEYALHEGDMVLGDHLTPADDLAILQEDKQNKSDDSSSWYRKMHIKSLFKWPEVEGVPTVYYRIHKTASEIKTTIYAAMEEWSSKTCIRFQELGLSTNETVVQLESSLYHILFISIQGCWSVLGHQGWNKKLSRQPLSLGKGCKKLHTAIHEIGHALGLVHEQARADRDSHIKIIFSNVKKANLQNFKKAKTEVKVPYDFTSIMHYGMNYFSKNGNPTLVPLDPHMFRFLVTKSTKLTFRDVSVVNTAYNCIGKWSQAHPNIKCENGGYANAVGDCVCPPNTSGTSCEQSTGVYYPPATCGGNFTEPTIIKTPNFPKPFPKNSGCTWWFVAPECHRVKITFKSFDLLKRYRSNCKWDFMELRTEDPIYPGVRYCDRDLESGARFLSAKRHLLINFRGKYTFKTGFEADVTFIPETRCSSENILSNLINEFY